MNGKFHKTRHVGVYLLLKQLIVELKDLKYFMRLCNESIRFLLPRKVFILSKPGAVCYSPCQSGDFELNEISR